MEQQKVAIREVTAYLPDIETAVKKLIPQLSSDFQEFTEQDLRMMIENDATHLYLAYYHNTNEIVGMITLIVYRIPYKMKGWIEDVVVDETYRHQGIGEALMKHTIEEAKKFGVKSLNLTSNPKRVSANHLYQRLGFEKRETNVYRLSLLSS